MNRESAIQKVVIVLGRHENDLSDGYYYYLPLDKDAEEMGLDVKYCRAITLRKIASNIVDAVLDEFDETKRRNADG